MPTILAMTLDTSVRDAAELEPIWIADISATSLCWGRASEVLLKRAFIRYWERNYIVRNRNEILP